MIVLHTDLDNTLIYSYKRDIGEQKRCVEIYQGRAISFMSEKSYRKLKEVKKKVLVVPTTTRTLEQYKRINLGIGMVPYALVCNGGVLLKAGEEDEAWYEESLRMVADCQEQLEIAERMLEVDPYLDFEIRNIQKLFIFTKSCEPDKTIAYLKQELDTSLVDVFSNGVKVYVVPKQLSKGEAVRRFRKYIKEEITIDTVIAAGDSEFDVSMLHAVDIGLAPMSLGKEYDLQKHVICIEAEKIFAESILEYIMKISNESLA